jgi:hypothetical protein
MRKWYSIPPISTKLTTTSQLNSLNTKKTMTHDVGNAGPGLEKTQKYGRVKLVNGIPTPLLDSWVSNGNTYINK